MESERGARPAREAAQDAALAQGKLELVEEFLDSAGQPGRTAQADRALRALLTAGAATAA